MSENIEIKVGIDDKYEVIKTGTLFISKDNHIDFSFNSGGDTLKFKLIFEEDDSVSSPKNEIKIHEDENYLEFKIINPYHSAILGKTEPMPLARLNGRKLCLSFKILNVVNLEKEFTFNYSWLLKKQIDE